MYSLSDFDFDLPEERIALRPVSPRDAARLLVVRPGSPEPLADRGVRDLVELLQPGDALLIAGKGHETGQIVGSDVFPFDDAEQASVAVAALDGRI